MRENLEYPVDEATLDVFAMPESVVRDRPMVFVVAIQTQSLKKGQFASFGFATEHE